MSENPFIDSLKDSAKKITKKYPKLSKIIGVFILLISLFLLLPQFSDSCNTVRNLFSPNEKTDAELISVWLKENFTDTTYNVLILPFNDYQESKAQKIKIEQAIQDRLDKLYLNLFPEKKIRSTIKIKCFLEIDEFLPSDSIYSIGEQYNADLIIYGDVYDLFNKDAKRTNVRYLILSESKKELPFKLWGETGLIEFTSLDEIKEGYIIKDLDYLTTWIFCNEQLFLKRLGNAIRVWKSIEDNFKEDIFRKTNSYLCAIIGEFSYWNKDYTSSKIFFHKSLDYHTFVEALIDLSLSYSAQSDYDSAKILLEKALILKPNSSEVHNNLAILYMENFYDYKKAEQHLKKAIELNPKNGYAFFNLGLLCGRDFSIPDSAKYYFSKAITLLPDSSSAVYDMIGNLYRGKNNSLAKYFHIKSIQIDPKNASAYYNLGFVYQNLKNYDSARYYYSKSIMLKPDYADAHNNLGLLYKNKLGNFDSAFYHLQKALKINPKESKYYYNLGLLYEGHFQKIDTAVTLYKKSLELNPYHEEVCVQIAELYRKNYKNVDSARIYYEKTLHINSNNFVALNNLAILMSDNYNEYLSSEKYYLKAIEIKPESATAHFNYANLLRSKLKNPKKAKEHYYIAIKLDNKLRVKALDEYYKTIL